MMIAGASIMSRARVLLLQIRTCKRNLKFFLQQHQFAQFRLRRRRNRRATVAW